MCIEDSLLAAKKLQPVDVTLTIESMRFRGVKYMPCGNAGSLGEFGIHFPYSSLSGKKHQIDFWVAHNFKSYGKKP